MLYYLSLLVNSIITIINVILFYEINKVWTRALTKCVTITFGCCPIKTFTFFEQYDFLKPAKETCYYVIRDALKIFIYGIK